VVFGISLNKTVSRIRELSDPVVVCHIDADGLTSGGIMAYTLRKMGKKPDILPLRQLDSTTRDEIPWDRDLIFVDMGSGQIDWTEKHVIIDHHQPIRKTPYQFNAHYVGLDGAREISASGLSYIVSKELIGDSPMAGPAVVGMMGDRVRVPLSGPASLPLKTPFVRARKGLTYFGRETRPLTLMLQYASDPFIPGISSEMGSCYTFLEKIGIDPKRTYHSLDDSERTLLNSSLVSYASSRAVKVHQMLGEYYVLPRMPAGTEMRDASEFSTLLNACGRHDRPEIGLGLVTGEKVYPEAQKLLRIHRKLLSRGIEELLVKGIENRRSFQLFTSETIKPTLIGIVAGIGISSRIVDHRRPIIALSKEEEGYKVSGRGTLELIENGLNIGKAMQEASKDIGEGGGHDIAAGAFIPEAKIGLFLSRLEAAFSNQMKGKKS
jgi:single-stranded-DNA-specific exonuclease